MSASSGLASAKRRRGNAVPPRRPPTTSQNTPHVVEPATETMPALLLKHDFKLHQIEHALGYLNSEITNKEPKTILTQEDLNDMKNDIAIFKGEIKATISALKNTVASLLNKVADDENITTVITETETN
jgi:hypothetical protein